MGPILQSSGIHPWDGDEEKILFVGKEMGKNQSPSGMARPGTDNGVDNEPARLDSSEFELAR
jgi:hypothetical protein